MPERTLPIYTPLMIIKTLGTGANQPMLIRATTREGVKNDIVAKLMASERMDTDRSMRELVGAFMAIGMGLKAPIPCLTLIDASTEALALCADDGERLANSKGLNFSSLYVEDLIQRVKSDALPNRLRSEALKIFFFDLLIQNPDRTVKAGGKTNLFTTGDDLWVLDHELAFSFLDLLFPSGSPWQFTAEDIDGFVKSHVLYVPLKGKQLDFSVLDGILDQLDEAFWSQLIGLLPPGWDKQKLERIAAHVNSVKQNVVLFTNQVKQILS